MYFVWLIIAVRLIVPLRFELPSAPIEIKFPERVVVMRTNAPSPIEIMTEDERAEAAVHEASSFNYAPIMTLTELLTLIWAAGASIFFLLHILKYVCFRLSVKPYLKNTNEKDVKLCGRLSSPVAAGFFRPAVLLPDIDFGAEELSMILLHERTHIKRGDLWYKLLAGDTPHLRKVFSEIADTLETTLTPSEMNEYAALLADTESVDITLLPGQTEHIGGEVYFVPAV